MKYKKQSSDEPREIGHVYSVFSGVAKVSGLPHVFLHEVLISDDGDGVGIVVGFDKDKAEVLFFDENNIPDSLFRSKEPFSIPISADYIGRVIDGLGRPIGDKEKIYGKKKSVFGLAPGIIDRQPVNEPVITGIKVIDAVLPLGRGQRELILGDAKIGKSTIARDMVLNQGKAEKKIFCVYVIIGQKRKFLDETIELFKDQETFSYTCVVAATAGDSYASLYLAPFVGQAIAEQLRDKGKDVLIVFDDFSKHAKAYRSVSLLFNRAPGREAYPGDIFSLHAQLLERAGKLKTEKGGGSISAIPIIETEEGDITSFIPTNLISITDGQIYLERSLFQKRVLPAINIGLSVSRLGSQVQPAALKTITSGLRLSLSQFKELQKISKLEESLKEETGQKVLYGKLMTSYLNQFEHTFSDWVFDYIFFYLFSKGLLSDMAASDMEKFESLFNDYIKAEHPQILTKIKKDFLPAANEGIEKAAAEFRKEFETK